MIGFKVSGIPAPQGSKRHVGGGRLVEMSKRLPKWRTDVHSAAAIAAKRAGRTAPFTGPIRARMTFIFERPKVHYRTGRFATLLKPTAPVHHLVTPDLDKLARAILDAGTGVLWVDDAQVVRLELIKRYAQSVAEQAGVQILIDGLDKEEAA